jgi:hypothetical protein
MSIEICSIEKKLNDQFFHNYRNQIIATLKYFISVIIEYESSGQTHDIYSLSKNPAENSINERASELSEEILCDATKELLDTLRHTFACYAFNGLHQLYIRQENEYWHPKVILKCQLKPNDLYTLDQEVTLYRGCSIDEYNSRTYGQAWSTSLDIAKTFAYDHYAHYDWFDKSKRVVMVVTFNRDDAFFSDQSVEYEVVVDTNKLENVQKHT